MCEADKKERERPTIAYQVELSVRAVVLSVVISTIAAFLCGRTWRSTFVVFPQGQRLVDMVRTPFVGESSYVDNSSSSSSSSLLLANTSSSSSSNHFHRKNGWIAYEHVDENENTNGRNDESNEETASGQHLFVDIEKVDPSFLLHPSRLLETVFHSVDEIGDDSSLLSYRCNDEQVQHSYYCVAILEEGHIHIRTWPVQGVLLLDLFLKDEDSMTNLLPIIENLFGVDAIKSDTNGPQMTWSIKRRGARSGDRYNPEDIDLSERLLGSMATKKKQVISVESDFQTIDIYDVMDLKSKSVRKSLIWDRPYEAQDLVPDRVVYLDSIMQSRRYGEAAYHEALVHPMLFLHDNPKRVAIIGGGEGATLREVLKHKTVENVVMIDIDEVMVKTSRTYLPEWSDCSNLMGSADSCFDDPRAEIYFEDAIAWFIDRYLDQDKIDQKDLFDVIILDALDPSSVVEFSDVLYGNDHLMNALSNAVGAHGIVGAQIGEVDGFDDLPNHLDPTGLDVFENCLKRAGFSSIVGHNEAHGRFLAPWDYLVAVKDETMKKNWFRNEAEVALAIQRRAMKTKTGESVFRYFDDATMMTYTYSNRIDEELWCRNEPTPKGCKRGSGYDPEIPNVPVSALQVKPSGAIHGAGVYSTVSIPENAYIGLEDTVHGLVVPPSTYRLIRNGEFFLGPQNWNALYADYLDAFGWTNDVYGAPLAGVDTGILALVQHGYNGTYQIGEGMSVTESQVDLSLGPGGIDQSSETKQYLQDPVTERQFPNRVLPQALRNIQAGEELLDNHLVRHYGKSVEHWTRKVRELQAMSSCSPSGGSTREP